VQGGCGGVRHGGLPKRVCPVPRIYFLGEGKPRIALTSGLIMDESEKCAPDDGGGKKREVYRKRNADCRRGSLKGASKRWTFQSHSTFCC